MTKTFRFLALLLVFTAGSSNLVAGTTARLTLKRVEAKRVCMINERAMDKDQIPVKVGGKTYFGCCEMCKKALTTDASKRRAVDPVSGKTVDKATAVIAAADDGKVFYFENERNLAKYNGTAKR